jgi:hypothetical protein
MQYLASSGPFSGWREEQAGFEEIMVSLSIGASCKWQY